MNNYKFFKNLKTFKKASFNSSREIRQNVGGDGDGPKNNTSRHFSKRARGGTTTAAAATTTTNNNNNSTSEILEAVFKSSPSSTLPLVIPE